VVKLTKEEIIRRMCSMIGEKEDSTACRVLRSSLYSARETIRDRSSRRVFIQDLATSLERRGLLKREDVEQFTGLGYLYTEESFIPRNFDIKTKPFRKD